MKMTSFALVTGLSIAACSAALAADKPADSKAKSTAPAKASKTKTESAPTERGVLVTGSYLKQDIHRTGQITDGQNQLVVLDRQTIERSGATDLKQLLNRTGIH